MKKNIKVNELNKQNYEQENDKIRAAFQEMKEKQTSMNTVGQRRHMRLSSQYSNHTEGNLTMNRHMFYKFNNCVKKAVELLTFNTFFTKARPVTQSFFMPALAIALSLLAFSGLSSDVKVATEEVKKTLMTENISGDPPENGLRYWKTPFEKLQIHECYASVITSVKKNGKREYEIWHNTWGDEGATTRCMKVYRGPSLNQMRDDGPVFNGTLITDVPDPKNPEKLSDLRGVTRPFMLHDPEFGYVLLACVCPGYQAPLLPSIFLSKTGKPGTFKYLGKLKGEPATEASRQSIWSDGGSLVRLKDGRWRIYLNGYGQVITALESDKLDGEWKFIRDGETIREMLPDFQKSANAGGCFPTVLKVAEDNWHLWISDKWEPQSIWHYWSPDGLTWKQYGQQPEITRAAFDGRVIKCLRVYQDPVSGDIGGLVSVWGSGKDEGKWILYMSSMTGKKP